MRSWIFVVGVTTFLSGCVSTFWPPETGDSSNHSPEVAREVKGLFSQPYIDPITRYMQRHQSDPSRAMYIDGLRAERTQRCQKIAGRYSHQPLTAASLEKLKKGYQFSCPQEVEAFAQRLANHAYGKCYLLTKLHNFSESVQLCQEAAEQGDPRSQLNMAVSAKALRDYGTAIYWAEQAAEHYPQGSYLLGQLYAAGLGVEQSHAEAAVYYELAAEKGLPAAQTALGQIYLYGQGVEKDSLTARNWLLMAARQDEAQALLHLGEISEEGVIGGPDLPQAMVWYDLATQNGLQEARKRLQKLSQELDTDELAYAQLAVREQLLGHHQ